MKAFLEEAKCIKYRADDINSLHLTCKNYHVHISRGTEPEIIIRFHNNRFRKMHVAKNGFGLYMEEQMAVTFYEFFRLLELMKDNVLEIEIPPNMVHLNISIETGVTGIDVDEIHAQTIHLKSSSGQIRICGAWVAEKLTAHSVSGRVYCLLPGTAADYDINCRAEQKDQKSPFYPSNPDAKRKIFLRSNLYVPRLDFME